MAMQTLDFDAYDVVSKKLTPRLVEHAPEDGFGQRALDGINANLQNWALSYSKRAGADVKAVGDFFIAHKGYQAFYWTPPGDVQRKFTCDNYTRTLDHYNVVQSISATLEEIP